MNIISAFLSGFVLAKPVMQVKSIYENRGRVMASMFFAATAFVFLMTSFLLGTIELVLQFDAQGFVIWSTMLTLSALFLAFCGISGLLAKAAFPKTELSVAPQLQDMIHKVLQGLANQFPPQGPETSSQRAKEEPVATAQEIHRVMEEREKIRQHPRGDLDLNQIPTPGFTH